MVESNFNKAFGDMELNEEQEFLVKSLLDTGSCLLQSVKSKDVLSKKDSFMLVNSIKYLVVMFKSIGD